MNRNTFDFKIIKLGVSKKILTFGRYYSSCNYYIYSTVSLLTSLLFGDGEIVKADPSTSF